MLPREQHLHYIVKSVHEHGLTCVVERSDVVDEKSLHVNDVFKLNKQSKAEPKDETTEELRKPETAAQRGTKTVQFNYNGVFVVKKHFKAKLKQKPTDQRGKKKRNRRNSRKTVQFNFNGVVVVKKHFNPKPEQKKNRSKGNGKAYPKD